MFRTLRPPQMLFDGALALFFFASALVLEAGTWVSGFEMAGGLLAIALLAIAVAMRRLSPALSLSIAWAGAIAQMLVGLSPRPSDVAIFGVLYATAAYGSRLVYWLGFASAFFGSLVITVYLFGSVDDLLSFQTLSAAVVALFAALFALLLSWVTGALVRTARRARETRAAQIAAESATVTEQERVRIARDMHDVVAHSLAVVIAQADGARYAAASDPDAAAEALGTISSTARAALADVRLLLTQLRHSQGEGPQPTLADIEALFAHVRAAGVTLRVEVAPTPPDGLPAAVQLAVYRILQEALTNALRHGDGGVVNVRMAWFPQRVHLEVRNGRASEPAPGGHGVIGMRERAQLVGGTLGAGAEGGDFVVSAALPIGGEK